MNRMTEGQVVWVRSGARATVIREPGVAGVHALVDWNAIWQDIKDGEDDGS